MATTAFVLIQNKLAMDLEVHDHVEIAGIVYVLASVHPYRKQNLTRLIFLSHNLDTIDMLVNKTVPFVTFIHS